jgi:uncharacterized alkaline shock family protein YloU
VTQTVHQTVIGRIKSLTGFEVTELNITVYDVSSPEQRTVSI